nr:WYL domain-containing protein [Iamia sp. SCSIO 61187]
MQRANAVAPYAVQATVRLAVPLAHAQTLITRTTGVHRPDGPDATIVELGGSSLPHMAAWLAGLGVPVEVLEPPALGAALRAHAETLLAANRR